LTTTDTFNSKFSSNCSKVTATNPGDISVINKLNNVFIQDMLYSVSRSHVLPGCKDTCMRSNYSLYGYGNRKQNLVTNKQ